MAQESSFDVVSKVDLQEADNAVNQSQKEIATRFDFRGSRSAIVLDKTKGTITITADDEYKRKAVFDILFSKWMKRGISPKALEEGTPEPAGGDMVRQVLTLRQGIASDKAKEIVKFVKEGKWKVQASIQGDQLRVSGKSKDELQTVIAALRAKDFGVPLQFTNYR